MLSRPMSEEQHDESFEAELEHFLPIRLNDLMAGLLEGEAGQELRPLFELYVRLFHAQLRPTLEALHDAYAPLRPDEDVLDPVADEEGPNLESRAAFLKQLDGVLRRANYRKLSKADLDLALTRTSPHGLQVSVNLEDYSELELYTRGRGSLSSKRRDWKRAYLRKTSTETSIYRRLFLVIALDPKDLHLKLFRDVPESDLEMLLPNTRVRIHVVDKVKLGLTGGGGAAGGAFTAFTKLSATVNPVTACLAIAGLAGVLWRVIAKVFAQRTKYMAALKSKLYFHNLDNNQGALNHLVELAGEEECKEALLAYKFLWEQPATREQLDRRVESYLSETYDMKVDYEVSDGLRKLREVGWLSESAEGVLSVVDPVAGRAALLQRWIELGEGGLPAAALREAVADPS